MEYGSALIREINRTFDGSVELIGSAETVIANMSYRDNPIDQAATAIRDIAGGHLFDNGNHRTAEVVAQRILGDTVDSATIRTATEQAGRGQIKTVEDIAGKLRRSEVSP